MREQSLITQGAARILYLSNNNELYEEEIFSATVSALIAASEEIARQRVRLYTIAERGLSTDVLRLDILRGCLKILMGLKEIPGLT